jgi:dienelactone hydrolase
MTPGGPEAFQTVPLIPREVLFANPRHASPTISPGDTRLAYVGQLDGLSNVYVGPLDDPAAARPLTSDQRQGIHWYGFCADDRTLYYLRDAVDHLAARGSIDRGRVAIMGGSYGGYAALAGAAFTPEGYRCAIDLCGPANLLTFLASIPPYWRPLAKLFHARVGDPQAHREMLVARSPVSAVDRIRIPVLVAQGGNDARVKRAEAEQIVAALRANGVPHEYLLFEDEGHGLARPETGSATTPPSGFWPSASAAGWSRRAAGEIGHPRGHGGRVVADSRA